MKVGAVISALEKRGWRLARMRGSHRIFRHPGRKGMAVVAGKVSQEMPEGTLGAVLRQSGLTRSEILKK